MRYETFFLRDGRKDITLTAYVRDHSPEISGDVKRPAVIICPGGAYLNLSDREAEPVALAFLNMGYHAFVLRYGVYSEGEPGVFFPEPGAELPVKEHCLHPEPMRDIARAFLKIREYADEWHVDTDRIAVCGFSAGAHNCAMYATRWHEPVISEYFGKPAETFRPAACILCYGISDYVYMEKVSCGTDPIAVGMFEGANLAFLGTQKPTDAQLEDVSPVMHATKYVPPVFLWATSEDDLVPVQQTLRMAHALADGGIPFELHVFENGPHGLSNATQSSAISQSFMNADVAKWLPLCETWLNKRFALSLPALAFWQELQTEN